MTQNLPQVAPRADLQAQGGQSYTTDQLDLIKRTCAKNATDDELALFLYQGRKKDLDPLSNEIYFMKFGDRVSIVTGINGYYKIASKTGQWAGNESAFEYNDRGQPTSCTVTVKKLLGQSIGYFKATADMGEYLPVRPSENWRKMPKRMLEKCAESLALRKAFPAETAGVYTQEEMEQAFVEQEDKPQQGALQRRRLVESSATPVGFDPKNTDHMKYFMKRCTDAGIHQSEWLDLAKMFAGRQSSEFDVFLQEVRGAAPSPASVVEGGSEE